MKIFLSAVSSQFRQCRDALRSDLAAVGAEVVVQEDFQQHGRSLLEKLEQYIASCDRVIALIGNAYGWEPDEGARPVGRPRRSYTQWEYYFAQGERLNGTTGEPQDVFVYFAAPEYLTANAVTADADAATLQGEFCDAVRSSGKDWNRFATLNELRALVLRDGFRLDAVNPALRDPKQRTTIRGNQNVVVQIVGDDNQVNINQPQLNLVRYGELTVRDTIGLIYAQARSIPLFGRQDELASLESWANAAATVSVRVLVGGGGSGKTRLAMELCERLTDSDWDAGFLTSRELERFLAQQNLATWGWSRPTLVVVDYAAARAASLNTWLTELACNPGVSDFPFRMLLLERHADPQMGWWREAFGRGGAASYAVQGLLEPPEPVRIAPLLPGARREVLDAMLEKLGSDDRVPADGDAPQFDDQLENLTWGGDPLYLMMAACRAHELGLREVLVLNRTELVMAIAQEERARLTKLAQGRHLSHEVLCHMAAIVTLCGGLSWEELADAVPAELEALRRRRAADPADIADALLEALPGGEGRIAPVLPDAVGEDFILDLLYRNPVARHVRIARGVDVVARAWKRSNWAVVDTLIRCVQDFGGMESDAALSWLTALADDISDSDGLMELQSRLPESSVALGQFAVRVSRRVVDSMKKKALASGPLPEMAHAQRAFATRLYKVSDYKGALAAAHHAVNLYRALDEQNTEVFRPDLAMSLDTLSNCLSKDSKPEDALKAAREAVDISRPLAEKEPKALLPKLAGFLNNLSVHLLEAGAWNESLETAQEAVGTYRELVAKNSDAFHPKLAASLNNLAIYQSALGKLDAALAPAQEAVEIYRALAAKNPDDFRPGLAMSLNTLARCLSEPNTCEVALEWAQESVKIRRALADKDFDAFGPDLAASLGIQANCLSMLGEFKEALTAVQKAVETRRKLAAKNRDAFEPALAMSLNNLARCQGKLRQCEAALASAQEAMKTLLRYFSPHPEPFVQQMRAIVLTYVELCEACQVSPEQELLEPVQKKLRAMCGDGLTKPE